jgi:hypothetical protein
MSIRVAVTGTGRPTGNRIFLSSVISHTLHSCSHLSRTVNDSTLRRNPTRRCHHRARSNDIVMLSSSSILTIERKKCITNDKHRSSRSRLTHVAARDRRVIGPHRVIIHEFELAKYIKTVFLVSTKVYKNDADRKSDVNNGP